MTILAIIFGIISLLLASGIAYRALLRLFRS
jgi:hypothetical protein